MPRPSATVRTPFGQRMLDSREAAGLKQEDVAEKLNLSQSTIAGLEKTAEGTSHVTRFARIYGVDAHWLATGEAPEVEITFSPETLEIAKRVQAMKPHERSKAKLLMLMALDGKMPDEAWRRPDAEAPIHVDHDQSGPMPFDPLDPAPRPKGKKK